jgi:hypothetical protein
MLEFNITNKKDFMNKLLCTDCFNDFLLSEAVIAVRTTHTIDGRLNRDYYEKDEWEDRQARPYDHASWADIRPVCLDLIKGKRTPASLKFILLCSPSRQKEILADGSGPVTALALRISFQNDTLSLTTGVSYSTFVPGHDAEHAFDSWVRNFLSEKQIENEEA